FMAAAASASALYASGVPPIGCDTFSSRLTQPTIDWMPLDASARTTGAPEDGTSCGAVASPRTVAVNELTSDPGASTTRTSGYPRNTSIDASRAASARCCNAVSVVSTVNGCT